jgi:hypothetical protein
MDAQDKLIEKYTAAKGKVTGDADKKKQDDLIALA